MNGRGGNVAKPADYKGVLEDLKRQRDELDRTIKFMEKIDGGNVPVGTATIEDDTFHGKNILQATEKYLRMVGRPARSTEDIAEALGKGGLTTSAGSVATILGRDKSGVIQRVKRGLWGLTEWYAETK
jgi:hypothetical protein